jgi:lysyl endopeptidase
MKNFFECISALGLCWALVGCGGGAESTAAPEMSPVTSEPKVEALTPVQPKLQAVLPVKALALHGGSTPFVIALPALPSGSLAKQAQAVVSGQPIKIGTPRAVMATQNVQTTHSHLDWVSTPQGGKVAALQFNAVGAKGLRLGVLVTALPPGAVMRFFSAQGATALEVSALDVMSLVQRNLDAGDPDAEARTYWSPDLGGSQVTLEIEVPPGIRPDSVQIAVPRLSHVFTLVPEKEEPVAKAFGTSGTCNQDVSCNPDYDATSRSVARIRFVVGGGSYICSGTLLNNQAGDQVPYFLTANHCIDSQSVASSLVTDWFYRSSFCNSGAVGPSATSRSGGAVLLYNAVSTDTSFLRLNSAPPPGVTYAGWSSEVPAIGMNLLALHYPSADLQKYSLGTVRGYQACMPPTQNNFFCASSPVVGADHIAVSWKSGVVEQGSSGSGLFSNSNGKRYLVGQLHGGSSSCENPTGTDAYGRFDLAYQAALQRWLTPTATSTGARSPVYRFYNTVRGNHFYTIDAGERDLVIALLPDYHYEGIAFYDYAKPVAGATELYRFYNAQVAAHFFTSSLPERDYVRASLPAYSYEGVAWYTSANSQVGLGLTPVYRFYNSSTAAHFYTISEAERDGVQKYLPKFAYEGIAFYASTSP